jgi:hypothetical protein
MTLTIENSTSQGRTMLEPQATQAPLSPLPPLSSSTLTVKCRQDHFEVMTATAEFTEYARQLHREFTILQSKTDPTKAIFLVRALSSRYFPQGRKRTQANIRKRLGRRWNSPGVMLTLTYDPKQTTKLEAWSSFNLHFRTLMDSLNTRRRRSGSPNLKYLWVVEEQPGTGYPHLHIFFPQLQYLAPVADLRELWIYGRHECKYKDGVNVATYICKYISKLTSWSVWSFALIWKFHKRLFGYSKCYILPYTPELPIATYSFFHSTANLNALSEHCRLFDTIFCPVPLPMFEKGEK